MEPIRPGPHFFAKLIDVTFIINQFFKNSSKLVLRFKRTTCTTHDQKIERVEFQTLEGEGPPKPIASRQ